MSCCPLADLLRSHRAAIQFMSRSFLCWPPSLSPSCCPISERLSSCWSDAASFSCGPICFISYCPLADLLHSPRAAVLFLSCFWLPRRRCPFYEPLPSWSPALSLSCCLICYMSYCNLADLLHSHWAAVPSISCCPLAGPLHSHRARCLTQWSYIYMSRCGLSFRCTLLVSHSNFTEDCSMYICIAYTRFTLHFIVLIALR